MESAVFSVEKHLEVVLTGSPVNCLKLPCPSVLKNRGPILSPPPFLQYISKLPCFVRNVLMAGTILGRAQLFHVSFDRKIQGHFL